MSVQVTALNENVATMKREWQGSQRRVGELEKQTDELRGEIAVLEATVQNNQDERRALLERCEIFCFNLTFFCSVCDSFSKNKKKNCPFDASVVVTQTGLS